MMMRGPISPTYSLINSITTVHLRHHHTHPTVTQAQDLHDYYQNNATKYWNNFYKRHQNKFFKDRHYLEKDWGHHFCDNAYSPNGKVILEVGCGAGNTIFPLLAAYPKLYIHACDFSPQAIALVKSHVDFREDRVNAFVCDVTNDDLSEKINPSSADVVTLPNGYVLLRDYAIGDFAQVSRLEICVRTTKAELQVKLQGRNQMISEDFYVRGDGTCSFYFSEDFLSTLFLRAGFNIIDVNIYCKQIENRSRDITMDRRWIRAIFNVPDPTLISETI